MEESSGLYSRDNWNERIRIRRLKVHPAIFAAYVDLYDCARIMAQKMDDVLDHPEHKMIMREAEEGGYRMPDIAPIRARNEILKIYLKSAEPFRDVVERDGLIEFPAQTACNLHMVAYQCSLMIDDVCRNIRESDYMPWFGVLKKLEVPYSGPTSLQEVFNVWGSLVTSIQKQYRHGPDQPHRLPQNWTSLVV